MFGIMYRRELLLASRNVKVPIAIFVNNLILVSVTMFSYYLEFQGHKNVGEKVSGIAILNIYGVVSMVEFGFVLIGSLLLTVSCVQVEKKDQSLDVLYTAGVHPMSFLMAKLIARVTVIMNVILSGCPILAIVFYVGGVKFSHMMLMLIVMTCSCFYIGSIGIFCSSFCKRNLTAILLAYVFGFVVIAGNLMVVSGTYYMQKINLGWGINDVATGVSVGPIGLLLLTNPLYSFLCLIYEQLGVASNFFESVNFHQGISIVVNEHWVLCSCIVQGIISYIILIASSIRLTQKQRNKKAIL